VASREKIDVPARPVAGKSVDRFSGSTSPLGMDVRLYQDHGAFRALAEPFYATDTLRHTVALTAMARFFGLERSQPPVMATMHDDDGGLIGVGLRTPPWPVLASGLPADHAQLETFLTHWLSVDPELPGVSGPRETAEALAEVWVRLTGGTTKPVLNGRLFRLGELRPPVTTGGGRQATEDDFDLLVQWRADFALEALGFQRAPDEHPAAIRRMFANGDGMVVWEDGGKPVAWAAASAPISGMSRVGPVYTPPEHRGHGYGSAATAAVSQHARDAGATDVILFTDLANPTSNSIYQKIGYRAVYDSAEFEFVRLPSNT
jgi:RimJ/RimL family protein N-acetyltransferase